jgi:hypothetical protein
MADEEQLAAEEIARRGQEVRMRIRARLDALKADVSSGPAVPVGTDGSIVVDAELIAAVRRANQGLVLEIGRAAEEVLVLAEQEATRLITQAGGASPSP